MFKGGNSEMSLKQCTKTGVEINPIESADVDNCITLCVDCHQKVHQQDGCGMRREKCKEDI